SEDDTRVQQMVDWGRPRALAPSAPSAPSRPPRPPRPPRTPRPPRSCGPLYPRPRACPRARPAVPFSVHPHRSQLLQQPLRRRHAIAVHDQLFDLRPVLAERVGDRNPAVLSDVWSAIPGPAPDEVRLGSGVRFDRDVAALGAHTRDEKRSVADL